MFTMQEPQGIGFVTTEVRQRSAGVGKERLVCLNWSDFMILLFLNLQRLDTTEDWTV